MNGSNSIQNGRFKVPNENKVRGHYLQCHVRMWDAAAQITSPQEAARFPRSDGNPALITCPEYKTATEAVFLYCPVWYHRRIRSGTHSRRLSMFDTLEIHQYQYYNTIIQYYIRMYAQYQWWEDSRKMYEAAPGISTPTRLLWLARQWNAQFTYGLIRTIRVKSG